MLGFRGTGDATFCRCRIWLEYKPRTRSAQSIAGWDWGDGDRGCGHVINLLAPDSITFAELILLNSHSTRFGQKHPLPLSKGSELTHHPVSTLHTFRCMESMGDSWRTSHTLGRFPLSHGLPYHHCRGSKSSFTSDFPHFPKTLLKKTDQFYSDTMPAKQSKASNRTVSYFWRPQLVEFTQREQRRLVTPGHCMPFNMIGPSETCTNSHHWSLRPAFDVFFSKHDNEIPPDLSKGNHEWNRNFHLPTGRSQHQLISKPSFSQVTNGCSPLSKGGPGPADALPAMATIHIRRYQTIWEAVTWIICIYIYI